MLKCVPVKDMRNTAAFTQLVEENNEPIVVTKNGYDRFVVMKSAFYNDLMRENAQAKLLARIAVAEREYAEGDYRDGFQAINEIRAKYGI